MRRHDDWPRPRQLIFRQGSADATSIITRPSRLRASIFGQDVKARERVAVIDNLPVILMPVIFSPPHDDALDLAADTRSDTPVRRHIYHYIRAVLTIGRSCRRAPKSVRREADRPLTVL